MALTKEQIKAVKDLVIERVDVPEWGGDGFVYVRSMGGDERDEFMDAGVDTSGPKPKAILRGATARLLALCLCDEDGLRLFTSDDVVELGERNALVLARVEAVADRLNGFDKKAVERSAKNSKETPSGESGSD